MTLPPPPLPSRSGRAATGPDGPGRTLRLVAPEPAGVGDGLPQPGPATRAVIARLMAIRGARSACVLSDRAGVASAGEPGGDDAAAVVAWARTAVGVLGGTGGGDVEDLIITTATSYHVVRAAGAPRRVVHLELRRDRGNLAAARQEVAAAVRAFVPEPEPAAPAPRAAPETAAPAPRAAPEPAAPAPRAVPEPAPPPAPQEPAPSGPERGLRATPARLTLSVGDVLRYRRRRA